MAERWLEWTIAMLIEITRDGEPASAGQLAPDPGLARRILIVEDNYFVAHQCESALLDAGYEIVDTVVTADDAVRAAMDRRPELVLMDIYLPGKGDRCRLRLGSNVELLRRPPEHDRHCCCRIAIDDENLYALPSRPLGAPIRDQTWKIRSPAPTRRSPRRIAKRRTRKAARRNVGRPLCCHRSSIL